MTQRSRRHRLVDSPLGYILLTADDDALIGLHFTNQRHLPSPEWFGERAQSDPLLAQASQELAGYFAGERAEFLVPRAPQGSEFQRRVWAELELIEPGQTRTYGHVAEAVRVDGQNLAGLAQGVGQAVGHNPIAIIIPCHRVVGADGSMTGFAGGLERKRWLLAHEEPTEVRESRLF